ncbi:MULTISPECIES: TPM domain-containing protein [Bradyrhizobium]|uniref:TPM domain-containing protein n=1 Tax=Bradyrhizobium TaxID=374 RepID=UPI000488A664|nr:YgcG family protein [Bradyrhizobium ottawaense]MDA9415336.1 membrane protein [Bradyrhizobium sp. CCBAU 25360]MDA9448915.1 membrane protein [Bradyrhizobium sp. CCBAU 21360]MDA9456680.1 membrane protein [Bradyrhizobium sp. CCBAU 21359]MDA9475394.1 membrane protein [Bradyrhizobium sp. CCBAU 65884]MDA9483542.1 membrane protein [Bradyrhizobium sp. CCBAU 11445]MDA9517392.1 membrane protein [Bradyrhizobium sp. CCBAU 11430]
MARSSRARTASWWRAAFVAALVLAFALPASADVAVPQLTGRVVDQTGTLSSSETAALSQKLRDFETRKGSQIAVLIVPTTQPETIEQFSIRVAEAWKIGRKKVDDGAILVVAKNDRHLRIEVGYGLEGALTDVTSRRIIDEIITPKFRSGDFAGGIADGVERMMRVIDGEPLPVPSPTVNFGSLDDLAPLFIVTLFVSVGIGGAFRAALGRLLGSFVTGGIIAALTWFILGSFALALALGGLGFIIGFVADLFSVITPGTGRSRGGSWSSGSSSGGWSSGSSSSDSGGFSGGGGSFGGGGASGSW